MNEEEFFNLEEWAYQKYARNTVIDTIRKIRYMSKRTEMTREGILKFLRVLRREGTTPKKINEYLKYLNRWLEFKGEDKISYLKSEKRSYKVRSYDADQIALILRIPVRTMEDRRNKCMVLLALNSGLRRSEICNLRVVDLHGTYLSVINGKGGKDRDVYLDSYTEEAIKSYLPKRNNADMPYVFTTRKGKITPEYMGNIASQIRKISGVDFSWHRCRHTYAKNLLRNNVDLETIRQMLGHSNLSTTQIYSTLDSGEAMERIREKKPKFYKSSNRSNPCTFVNGLEGI